MATNAGSSQAPSTGAQTSQDELADQLDSILVSAKHIPNILPHERVFPIQVGTELFKLSGASLSSDGVFCPSYQDLTPYTLRSHRYSSKYGDYRVDTWQRPHIFRNIFYVRSSAQKRWARTPGPPSALSTSTAIRAHSGTSRCTSRATMCSPEIRRTLYGCLLMLSSTIVSANLMYGLQKLN